MLLGLKENVIVGKRIPAGTGARQFDKIMVSTSEFNGKTDLEDFNEN